MGKQPKSVVFGLRLSPLLIARLDRLRAAAKVAGSRGQLVRIFIEEGLDTWEGRVATARWLHRQHGKKVKRGA